MKKNDVINIEILSQGIEGEGVAKVNGFTLFVKDAVAGDTAEAVVTKVQKNFGYAKILRILKPSADRVEPSCENAKRCGGCSLQSMSYEAQKRFKGEKVKNNLIRIGHFDKDYIEAITEETIGQENPFRYRNKAQFPIGLSKDGEIIAGFYAERSHSIIPVSDCLLGVPENKEILDVVISWMKEEGVSPYDEKSSKGVVRHVLIRKGFYSGEIMVCLIINADSLGKKEASLVSRLAKIAGISSISLNINKENTNVILGRQTKCIWGSPSITDSLDGIRFSISPVSFYQVNPLQTEKLYRKALEYADLSGNEVVWDLYCGIGTISLFLARKAGQVHGVEIVPQAIEDAKKNAEINGIKNAHFTAGAAEDVAPKLPKPDVIVVDPPRKGCDKKLLDTILKHMPEKVVYVSCDSATLARDLEILCAGGYSLKKVCPVDQFAQTAHVETVVLMTRTK